MPAEGRRQEHRVRVLFELLERNRLVDGNLYNVSNAEQSFAYRAAHTGSSKAEMARKGILIARTESDEEASR
jgi:hypothetical protein